MMNAISLVNLSKKRVGVCSKNQFFLMILIKLLGALVVSSLVDCEEVSGALNRQKRFMIWPQSSPNAVITICGVGLPVIFDYNDDSMTVGSIYKAQYNLPYNASHWTNPQAPEWEPNSGERPYRRPGKRSIRNDLTENKEKEIAEQEAKDGNGRSTAAPSMTRWYIYKGVEALADSYKLNGRACMLRAICESAENPFTHENGILGELLHIILTPSTTGEEISEYSDNEYIKAEQIGREAQKDHENGHERCSRVFQGCTTPLLQIFTSVEYLWKTFG